MAVAELDAGWTKLRKVVGDKFDTGGAVAMNPRTIEKLDEWENLWFPITSATLGHHHPGVHEAFFLNLSQTSGDEVVLSVGMFVERYDALAGSPEGRAARAALAGRGLTDTVVDQARAMLNEARSIEEADGPDLITRMAEQKAAEEAMWRWYLAFRTIARTVIKDSFLLRRLGFRKTKRSTDGSVPSDELLEEGDTDEPITDASEDADRGDDVVAADADADVEDDGDIDIEQPVTTPTEPESPVPA